VQGVSGAHKATESAGGIAPGAVFTVDPSRVHLPAALMDPNAPHRDSRWLLVVSCKADCRQEESHTVLVVILSAKVEHFWSRHDVVIEKGDGGTDRQCIAQGDTVFPMLKSDIVGTGTYKGSVFKSTLGQVRAMIGTLVGLEAVAPGRDA